MLGNILEIKENTVLVNLNTDISQFNNLINSYVIFQDNKKIIGEINSIIDNKLSINLIGEIKDNKFIFGISTKPSFKATVGLINPQDIPYIISNQGKENEFLYLGSSPIYENIKINIDINNFFDSHFAILGGTGSGKSWSTARIIQNIFNKKEYIPYKSSLFVFDTYGEYRNAFKGIEQFNSLYAFKNYTTNLEVSEEVLHIPAFLFGVDDLAILLNATTPNQLQIIEKALRLVNIFKQEENSVLKIKNDIIARAILDILLSGRPASQIRDQIFSILSFYKTSELNLETVISQPGYNRSLKQCLFIDVDGKMREMELLTQFFNQFLLEEQEDIPIGKIVYNLKDIENALDFALISEGILKSEKIYDDNNLLKVRLHSLVNSENNVYFDYQNYVTKEEYINSLLTINNKKAQIINFNISYVDDRLAKTMVKIISKMLFDVAKNIKPRASMPFHILLEEAHRYVQSDGDVKLLGYNIFERISKEGRKYGILLGIISQRPSELSETVISQCNNFLIFKVVHPKDVEYIEKLIPFMTNEISKNIQIIQPGYCYGFGTSFKMPTLIKIDAPNPQPESNNVDISNTWFIQIK